MRNVLWWRRERDDVFHLIGFQVRIEPRARGGFVKVKRFGVVEMAAGGLAGGAAGMKNGGSLMRRQAGDFKFLERGGGNSRDGVGVPGRHAARIAQVTVGLDMLVLQGEQVASQFIEIAVHAADEGADSLGNFFEFVVHAVLVWLVCRYSRWESSYLRGFCQGTRPARWK